MDQHMRRRSDVEDGDSAVLPHQLESSSALVQYGLLRADPRLVPLHHVVAFFTQLLDMSSLISLPKAAAKGSVRLFNRVAARFMIVNLDRPQIDYWFARAMQAALEQDDLAMVKHIHALHPEPLFVHVPSVPKILYTNALGLAFKYGTLETVQWLVEHRSDRACCAPGIRNFCRACLKDPLRSIGDRDPFRIAKWLYDCGFVNMVNENRMMDSMYHLMQKSPAVIRWLNEQKLLSQVAAEVQLYFAIRQRRAENAMVLLDIIVSPMEVGYAEKCLLTASFGGLDDVAEKMISRGQCDAFQQTFRFAPVTEGGKNLVQLKATYVKKKLPSIDSTRGEVCCEAATGAGNLEVLHWLFSERGVRPKRWMLEGLVGDDTTLLAICKWMQTVGMRLPASLMDAAAEKGFLDTIKWLYEHTTVGCTKAAMDNAASNGHLDVVQWLTKHRAEGCTARAMTAAAGNGHLEVVQWLHAHRREGNPKEAMAQAARYGHLHVIVWLARVSPEDKCTECLLDVVLKRIPTRPIDGQHGCTSIDVLRWIDQQPTALCASCRANDMRQSSGNLIRAAEAGDLELVNYLYDVHREHEHFIDPVDIARVTAQNGHLGTLQWIYAHFGVYDVREEDADDAEGWGEDWAEVVIEEAEEFGHKDILAWVHSLDEDEDEATQ